MNFPKLVAKFVTREKEEKKKVSPAETVPKHKLVLIDNSPQRWLNRISILESIFEDK